MTVLPPVLANLTNAVTPAAPATPVVPASSLAVERFNAIMQAAPAQADAAAGANAAISAVAVAAAETPLGLGQQILDALQQSSSNVSGRWQAITERLDSVSGAAPSVTDLLQVQTQLLQVSIHYELVGKAIAKSTQNIDTMVRLQ